MRSRSGAEKLAQLVREPQPRVDEMHLSMLKKTLFGTADPAPEKAPAGGR
jgi:hypothetical protein